MVQLKEDYVKDFLKKYMLDQKIEFRPEVRLGGCVIDFLAKFDGKWVGVEVKGGSNDIFLTLGQLVNYNKFVSHLYLCAPSSFIKKFIETYAEITVFKQVMATLGIIEFDGASTRIVKEPSNKTYYLKLPEQYVRKNIRERFPRGDAELDETDKAILNFLKTRKIATVWDIIQNHRFNERYKNPYETICKRLGNLEHFRYIKIINRHPKTLSLVSE